MCDLCVCHILHEHGSFLKCISILIICVFQISEFIYLLKLIFKPHINTCDTFAAIHGHVKNLSPWWTPSQLK
jgi:hypothetical protein